MQEHLQALRETGRQLAPPLHRAKVIEGDSQRGRAGGGAWFKRADFASGREEMMNTSERYLEDFAAGQTFGSGRLRVDQARIKTFAAEFDPQSFISTRRRRTTRSSGLAASGWHTAALTMRLLVEGELKPAGGVIGTGFVTGLWRLIRQLRTFPKQVGATLNIASNG